MTHLVLIKPSLISIYLIKDCAIQAKELNVHGLLLLAHSADVEHLAGGLRVGVVSAYDLARAREIRLRQVVKVQVLECEIFKYLGTFLLVIL